jgi:hypothetical protein
MRLRMDKAVPPSASPVPADSHTLAAGPVLSDSLFLEFAKIETLYNPSPKVVVNEM